MKIDAKIKWLIDEPELNIEIDKIENVPIDTDYVESDEYSVTAAIEEELVKKHGTSFYESQDDFIVVNMNDVLDDLKIEEFKDKTDLTINGPEM